MSATDGDVDDGRPFQAEIAQAELTNALILAAYQLAMAVHGTVTKAFLGMGVALMLLAWLSTYEPLRLIAMTFGGACALTFALLLIAHPRLTKARHR
jgi:hypothetical protein